MAISHCSVRHGRAGKGASHARYVQGEGRYAERDDVLHIEHGNMPGFAAADPLAFWQAADAHERANGRAYTEIQYAVPRELTERKDQIRFAQRMADGIVGVKHPYTLAMHDAEAADGGRNIHAHLMFSERMLDGIDRAPEQFFKRAAAPYRHRVTKEMMPADPARGGAAKNREMNAKSFVQDVRARYERTVNQALERAGVAERISMARNERREPEPKIGPAHPRADLDTRREARVEQVRELRAARTDARRIVSDYTALRSEILDLTGNIAEAKAAREAHQAAERAERERKRAESLARFEQSRAAASQPAPPPPSPEERRRAVIGDDVPDPRERLRAFKQAMEADLMRLAAKEPSEDEKRARDAESMRAQLAKDGFEAVHTPKPGLPYTGSILLVTDYHVAQDAGRRHATLHDRRQLQQAYVVGDKPRILYGQDGQEMAQTVKPRGSRLR